MPIYPFIKMLRGINKRFSFETPHGWKVEKNTLEGFMKDYGASNYEVDLIGPPNPSFGDFKSTISINIGERTYGNANLDRDYPPAFRAFSEGLKKQTVAHFSPEPQQRLICGVTALWHTLEYTLEDEGVKIQGRDYYFACKNRFFQILFLFPKAHATEQDILIERFLQSLVIT
jgi:hypothetical protein